MAVQTGPGPADLLCPGPTVAATSAPGELANMDRTFIIRLC